MEQIDFEYGGKHCQLIIFDKYERKTPKGEFNRLTKLVRFFDGNSDDRINGGLEYSKFDIKKTIHTGLWTEGYHKQKIVNNINSKNRIILDINKIDKLVRTLYKKYHSQIYCDFLRIFVYPAENMGNDWDLNGINGYASMENTVHIHINPNDSRWEKELNPTILHEVSHAYLFTVNKVYRDMYNAKWLNLVDWMISEGLSENYANSIMKTAIKGNKKNEWCGFTRDSALDQFKLLKNIIYGINDDDEAIMFGGGKYKRLTGYAIGYWIVKDYLKNTKKNIYDAHHATFKDILQGSGWLNIRL